MKIAQLTLTGILAVSLIGLFFMALANSPVESECPSYDPADYPTLQMPVNP